MNEAGIIDSGTDSDSALVADRPDRHLTTLSIPQQLTTHTINPSQTPNIRSPKQPNLEPSLSSPQNVHPKNPPPIPNSALPPLLILKHGPLLKHAHSPQSTTHPHSLPDILPPPRRRDRTRCRSHLPRHGERQDFAKELCRVCGPGEGVSVFSDEAWF